jgi:uncharacterized protein YukJ
VNVRPRTRHGEQTSRYGVLVGQVVEGREDPPGTPTPHYEIHVRGGGADYRIAVNVESAPDSEVYAHFDPAYAAPAGLDLVAYAGTAGFTELTTGPQGQGLDYLRDGLFPLDTMTRIAPDGSGVTLASLLDAEIAKAKADAGAVALAFGNFFEDHGRDEVFGFSPAQGVHDIHLMQDDPPGRYAAEDRQHGDGALFFRFSDGTTAALFIRFADQEVTGGPG